VTFVRWQDALDGYIAEMQSWVDAVRAGDSIDELIPVNAASTPENAAMLASRLEFIRTRLVDLHSSLSRTMVNA